MIDNNELKWRCSSCSVYFRGLPAGYSSDAIYIENEYHPKMNRYLRIWGWWLQKRIFDKYEYGYTNLAYLPRLSKKIKQKNGLHYMFPFLSKGQAKHIPNIKTTDLLSCLEDPDDARFLKPGFLFYKEMNANGISVYEYYPLVCLDSSLSYKEQIAEILKEHKKKVDNRRPSEFGGIGRAGLYSSSYEKDEEYADKMFSHFDDTLQSKLYSFKRQVIELKRCGVPMSILENILHQNKKLSKLVITKKKEIRLSDYHNMVIKMEPLVASVYFLFLKHPEGIIFKHLPDYREELTEIYKELRPKGLNKRALQSIADVTNPTSNSINEKCARIRAAFINRFNESLAHNYIITGERGKPKKITLPRDLVVWE